MDEIHFNFRQMHPLCVFQDADELLPNIGAAAAEMQRFDKMHFIGALARDAVGRTRAGREFINSAL